MKPISKHAIDYLVKLLIAKRGSAEGAPRGLLDSISLGGPN